MRCAMRSDATRGMSHVTHQHIACDGPEGAYSVRYKYGVGVLLFPRERATFLLHSLSCEFFLAKRCGRVRRFTHFMAQSAVTIYMFMLPSGVCVAWRARPSCADASSRC